MEKNVKETIHVDGNAITVCLELAENQSNCYVSYEIGKTVTGTFYKTGTWVNAETGYYHTSVSDSISGATHVHQVYRPIHEEVSRQIVEILNKRFPIK